MNGRAGPALAPALVVDGALVGRESGLAFDEIANPADQSIVGVAPVADTATVSAAVESAARAFEAWAALPAGDRSAYLARIASWLRHERANLARTITLEQGKPFGESSSEVDAAANAFDYYSAQAGRVYGETIPTASPTLRSMAIRQPIGPVAAIGTWNYPIGIMAWKLAPALAAGCTVVAKPAEQTPLAVLTLVAGAREAGLPRGVLNSVSGPGPTVGRALVVHPGIRKISFTGGTATGREILRLAADGIKSVTLELGGHSPMLVLADAPLDLAASDAAKRAFRNAGQLCNSVNRILVSRAVAEPFLDRFVAMTRRLVLGRGLDTPAPDVGPLTTERGLRRVEAHVADARGRGAEILTGGARPAGGTLDRGFFYEPTVVVGTPDLVMAREETFGPAVAVIVVDDLDEALGIANSLDSGLVAYLYTKDLRTATLASERLEFGTVNVNNVGGGDVPFPYSGWKHSGLGIELSHQGLEEYLRVKHVRVEVGYS